MSSLRTAAACTAVVVALFVLIAARQLGANPTGALGPITTITPSHDGIFGHDIFWARVDPTDAKRLMVCGFQSFSKSGGVAAGYVYTSNDGGMSWNRSLLDVAAPWTSEESCSYGPTGRVYYAASYDNLKTHLSYFRVSASDDHGKSWHTYYAHPSGRVDFSYITAIPHADVRTDKVVVFTNSTITGHVDSATPTALVLNDTNASHMKMLQSFDDRTRMSFLTSDATQLANGDMLFAGKSSRLVYRFPSRVITEQFVGEPELFVVSTFTDSLRHQYNLATYKRGRTPIVYVGNGEESLWPSIAQDRSGGRFDKRVYAAWTETDPQNYGSDAASTMWLATSTDSGAHWVRKPILRNTGMWSKDACAGKSNFGGVHIAVSRNGTLGVLWTEDARTLAFASSHDGGATFTNSLVVEHYLRTAQSAPSVDASPHDEDWIGEQLWTYKDGGLVQSNPNTLPLAIGFLMKAPYIGLTGLAADAHGIFHAFWSDPNAVILTRTVSVKPQAGRSGPLSDPLPPIACAFLENGSLPVSHWSLAKLLAPPSGSKDVSSGLALWEDSVRDTYDPVRNTLTFDFQLINTGKRPLREPLKIVFVRPYASIGTPVAANAAGTISGRPFWYIGKVGHSEILQPGAHTAPIHVVMQNNDFQMPPSAAYNMGGFLSTPLQVFEFTRF